MHTARAAYVGAVLSYQEAHLVLQIAAHIPEPDAGLDSVLDVAPRLFVHLGSLAEARFDLRDVHRQQALLRLSDTLAVITLGVVVDSSLREAVLEQLINLTLSAQQIRIRERTDPPSGLRL